MDRSFSAPKLEWCPSQLKTRIEKGRLGPGQMIVVDLETGEIKKNWQVKEAVAKAHPYGDWFEQSASRLFAKNLVAQIVPSRQNSCYKNS